MQKMQTHTSTPTSRHTQYPPVEEGGEDEDTNDAEGKDMEYVGQKHLPLLIEAILTLLIRYSPECRNYTHKHTHTHTVNPHDSIPSKRQNTETKSENEGYTYQINWGQ